MGGVTGLIPETGLTGPVPIVRRFVAVGELHSDRRVAQGLSPRPSTANGRRAPLRRTSRRPARPHSSVRAPGPEVRSAAQVLRPPGSTPDPESGGADVLSMINVVWGTRRTRRVPSGALGEGRPPRRRTAELSRRTHRTRPIVGPPGPPRATRARRHRPAWVGTHRGGPSRVALIGPAGAAAAAVLGLLVGLWLVASEPGEGPSSARRLPMAHTAGGALILLGIVVLVLAVPTSADTVPSQLRAPAHPGATVTTPPPSSRPSPTRVPGG